jgi:NAD(P)-dependent dehydrogenase (short-subunit alcohol dehydrogenase family)
MIEIGAKFADAVAPPLPDQSGRVYVVTGANAGIGRAATEALCAKGARVHLACRSREKAQPVVDDLRARFGANSAELLALDLADLDSVRACAAAFLATGEKLHVLVNNAGLAGTPGTMTKQGFELTFGTNHLGHFLLTQLLLPRMQESAPARVVFTSSTSHRRAHRIRFETLRGPTRSFSGVGEYEVSKLANVLCAAELARRMSASGHGPGSAAPVTTYALHPGTVRTEIWRRMPRLLRDAMYVVRGMITAEQGARTLLYCATSPEVAAHSGRYYAWEREETPNDAACDEALAKELWQWSEVAVSEH